MMLIAALSASTRPRSMPAHPLVQLAAGAIQTYLVERRAPTPPDSFFMDMPEALSPGAVFVCLKLDGQLRGCIGSVVPLQTSLALEVIHNAIGAATRDSRFPPVQKWEAELLQITVDVLGPKEPITGPANLDPRRFGLIVRAGSRQGLLLPDIEGVATPLEQITITREKAGIAPDEPVEFFRFEVTRYR